MDNPEKLVTWANKTLDKDKHNTTQKSKKIVTRIPPKTGVNP
jgi:hypothetical protein